MDVRGTTRGEVSKGDDPAVHRVASRVLILDDRDRLLLILHRDPALPDRAPFWLLPGGGLNPGESPRAAAAREVFEETGVQIDKLVVLSGDREISFDFNGVSYRQREHYFACRVEGNRVSLQGDSPLEQWAMTATRWWSRRDILTSEETISPPRLHELYDDALSRLTIKGAL